MSKVLIGNLYASDPASTGPQGPQGIQGIQGPAGAVGPAGLTWKGAWSSSIAYAVNDVVSAPGTNGIVSSYWAVQAGTNHAPSEGASNAWWALLTQEGAQGPQGIQGVKGDQGNPATNLVQSVNGKQGVVSLVPGDIGAATAADVDNVFGIAQAAVVGSPGFRKTLVLPKADYEALILAGTVDPDTYYSLTS